MKQIATKTRVGLMAPAHVAKLESHDKKWDETSLPVDPFAKTLLTKANQADMRSHIGAQATLSTVSQAEAEAGTATTERAWTAQRVAQAIAAKASLLGHGHAIADVTGLQAALDVIRPIAKGGTGASTAIGAHDAITTAGNNIAAAATLNLNNATGAFITVTGNTTINAVTLSAGRSRMVRFTGTPQLTAGANLVGNNAGKNIKVEPGDLALFEGHADGLVTFWLIRASGLAVRSTAIGKSMIVNGGFQISQENGNTAGTTSNYHLADQWRSEFSGAFGITASRNIVTTQALNSSRYRARLLVTNPQTTLGAGDYAMLIQPIEGNITHPLLWGTTTARPAVLAFNCAVPVGTYAVAIRNGANNRSCVIPFSVTTTATHRQTVAIPATTTGTWNIDANVGLQVSWVFACGSQFQGVEGWQDGNFLSLPGLTNGVAAANNFYIGDVSLHVDPDGAGIAPPFVVPDYADDLRECQRYFYTMSQAWSPYRVCAPSGSGMSAGVGAMHPVPMRTTPAMSFVWEINDMVQSSAPPAQHNTQYLWSFISGLSADQFIDVTKVTANARM